MKLNPPLSPRASGISSLQRFHPRSGFIPQKADLVEKDSELYPILSLFLVEVRGVEPLSENLLIQLSPGAECLLELFPRRAGIQARQESNRFMRDRLNDKRPMHVHH